MPKPVEIVIEPEADLVKNMRWLGRRWSIHEKVAAQRAKSLGILLKFNSRSSGVRLSDVIKAEEAATIR